MAGDEDATADTSEGPAANASGKVAPLWPVVVVMPPFPQEEALRKE